MLNGSSTIGYSQTPTNYSIHWKNGPVESVRCGADILLNGLTGDLEGTARCPTCQQTTRILINNGKIRSLEPSNPIIHVVEIPRPGSWRPWIECESTHIFDQEDCYQKWNSEYKGETGIVSLVQNYHESLMARRSKAQNSR